MTRRLYEEDSHCRRFTATVVSCRPTGEGHAVVLDQTAFFPESGGQSADEGTLNGMAVLQVQNDGDTVVHILKTALPEGTSVTGELNWSLRFSRMQKHTGEHIVSGLIFRLYGLDNVGFHLGHDDVTLDLNGELTREQLNGVERAANEAVFANVPVTATYPAEDELAVMSYRQKKELSGRIRIVTVEGYDACACCAPHVTSTGEIGIIKLLDAIRYKGGTRVHMQCGMDAVLDYEMRYRETAETAAFLSVKQNNLTDSVKRLAEQRDGLAADIKALRRRMAQMQVEQVGDTVVSPAFILQTDGDTAQETALSLAKKCSGTAAVFFGTDEAGYGFVLAGGENLPAIGEQVTEALSGRGGGTAQMVRGRVTASADAIREFWKKIGTTL